MIQINRNNLDKASSPYLQQHKDNPIHWQEWNNETLQNAKEQKKLIFVSIGYATCHWCHVMAQEAFSDKEIAEYLNNNFIAIKIDREQRPDIDQYMMSFITETQGHGGWPLNIILTKETKPFLAGTYFPITSKQGMPSFLEVLQFAKKHYEENKDTIPIFIPKIANKNTTEETQLISAIKNSFDKTAAGFGHGPKFPPHNTILFLLHYYEETKDKEIAIIIQQTLDTMAIRGLHDHLQGGFYRYCTDKNWTIPHFEKMLYDQAMLLMIYSAAYKLFKKEEYKKIVEKIIFCLEETFEENNLYYSAHDADTGHEEGATYLWDYQELKTILSVNEFSLFKKQYEISEQGNFDGKIHLIKNNNNFSNACEEKLLQTRKHRKQPFTDKKIITSWNCLIGIGLLCTYHCTNNEKAKNKALKLFQTLKKKHYKNNKLIHSSLDNQLQEEEFLQDYAAFLLFTTYIFEEKEEEKELMIQLEKKIHFCAKNGLWIESNNKDFQQIAAQEYDHPTPSSVSLAELAVLRTKIFLEQEYESAEYKYPLSNDFYNLVAFIKNGNFHIIHTKEKIDWNQLPLNTIQIKADNYQDCYKNTCREFKTKEEMIEKIKKN